MNLYDLIVLVTSNDENNHNFGTGFLIHRDEQHSYVLTCTHVIRDVNGFERVNIDNIPATVIAFDKEDGADLAVVQVSRSLNKPILQFGMSGEEGDSFLTIGFQKYGKWLLAKKLDGTLYSIVELAFWGRSDRAKAWNLKMINNCYLQRGYSGSPVINVKDSCVLGVVSARQEQGQQGIAVSVELVNQIWSTAPLHLFEKGRIHSKQNNFLTTDEFNSVSKLSDSDITLIVLHCVKELEISSLNKRVALSKLIADVASIVTYEYTELQHEIENLCIKGDLRWHVANRLSLTQQGKDKLRRYTND